MNNYIEIIKAMLEQSSTYNEGQFNTNLSLECLMILGLFIILYFIFTIFHIILKLLKK